MDAADIEEIIEAEIPDSEATVTNPRVHHDEEHDDAHFAATVVSPAFEGKSLVEQHQLVYDALGEHMTRDVHAMEIQTYTPEAWAEHGDGA